MQAITCLFEVCLYYFQIVRHGTVRTTRPFRARCATTRSGGFRPNHQTVDHLMVYKELEQRCREWGVPLYISTIDFTKAFDRIKHSALWSSLGPYGIGRSYVELLQRLYSQQEGTVLTDKESDVFPIKRGTKQGIHCRACCLMQYYNFLWKMI